MTGVLVRKETLWMQHTEERSCEDTGRKHHLQAKERGLKTNPNCQTLGSQPLEL